MFLFKKITVFKSKNLRVTGAAWVVCTVKIYNELKKNQTKTFIKLTSRSQNVLSFYLVASTFKIKITTIRN